MNYINFFYNNFMCYFNKLYIMTSIFVNNNMKKDCNFRF